MSLNTTVNSSVRCINTSYRLRWRLYSFPEQFKRLFKTITREKLLEWVKPVAASVWGEITESARAREREKANRVSSLTVFLFLTERPVSWNSVRACSLFSLSLSEEEEEVTAVAGTLHHPGFIVEPGVDFLLVSGMGQSDVILFIALTRGFSVRWCNQATLYSNAIRGQTHCSPPSLLFSSVWIQGHNISH